MSISCVTGSCAAAEANNVSFTTPNKNDVILVFAFNGGSVTIPSLASGYTNITTNSGNVCAARLAYKISNGTETGSGNWTNATCVLVLVYRGADINIPIGAFATSGAASATVTYPALTPQIVRDTSSWVVGVAGHVTSIVNTAPTGMTNRTSSTRTAGADTNGGVTSYSQATVGGNPTSGYRSYTVEIHAAQTTPPSPDPLVQHVQSTGFGNGTETGNTFLINFPQTTLANNLLVLTFTCTTGAALSAGYPKDNNGTSWTAGPTCINGNGVLDSRLYYLAGAPATTSVTVTFTGTVGEFVYELSEFHGPKTSAPSDGSSSSITPTLPTLQPGSITTTTDGDLIYVYAVATNAAWMVNNHTSNGIAADGGFVLASASRQCSFGVEYAIQTTHGAINPIFIFNQASDSFNILAMTFKVDGSGTAPSGTYIKHITALNGPGDTPHVDQFPTSGSLFVALNTTTTAQDTLGGFSDSNGNTWNNLTPAGGVWSQPFYAINTVASPVMNFSFTQSPVGTMMMRVYDVVGSGTWSYDSTAGVVTAQNSITGNADILDAPDFTPTAANEMVFNVGQMGTGPPSACFSPTGAVWDNCHYTGETDQGLMNYGDSCAHFLAPTTTLEAWKFHVSNGGASSGWNFLAFAFNVAAAGYDPSLQLSAGPMMLSSSGGFVGRMIR